MHVENQTTIKLGYALNLIQIKIFKLKFYNYICFWGQYDNLVTQKEQYSQAKGWWEHCPLSLA